MSKQRRQNQPVQSSYRLSRALYLEFQDRLKRDDLKMNAVLRDLIASWLEGRASGDDATVCLQLTELRAFLRWLPVAAVVKGLGGRILFANPAFQKLVCEPDLIGKQPKEYLEDSETASLIEECYRRVHKAGRPLVFVERLSLRSQTQHRMVIRFPITPHDELGLIGAVSFDLDQIECMTSASDSSNGDWRPREWPTGDLGSADCPGYFLTGFVHSLPGAAAVQDIDGLFLCVNDEYSQLANKRKREFEGVDSRQIWGAETAKVMMLREELVRHSRKPFVSSEKIPASSGQMERLNIRFPILGEKGEVARTGTLGFDHNRISKIVDGVLQLPTGSEPSVLVSSFEDVSFEQVIVAPTGAVEQRALVATR